jgi:putative ABC transport system permease protein
MIRLAYRNLFQNKVRLMISAGGVALALMLILALDAVMTGVQQRITAYIDYSGADVFVSQKNVRNMHMASSSISDSLADQVIQVDGVADVVPILYLSNMVVIGEERNLAYVIGVPEDATYGSAWAVEIGKAVPGHGEAVIDRGVAEAAGVGLGDPVEIFGRPFTISGLSERLANLVNSVAFISLTDFQALRGEGTVSFLLVRVQPGAEPEAVSRAIETQIEGVTAEPRAVFAGEERRVVRDMSTDLITIMNLIGFLIGLAVMALTVYTAALSRLKEYGVLKALGARNSFLYGTVLAQAFLSVIIGFSLGLAFTVLLSSIAPRINSGLVLDVSLESLLKVGLVSLVIAGFSALLPVRQIAGLDPALVFRGK